MRLSRHIDSHVKIWAVFLILAKLLWYHCVFCHRNLIEMFPHWTCLSDFCVNDLLKFANEVSQRRHHTFWYIYIFLLCCFRCFSILKYFINPKSFSSLRKEQLYLRELYQTVLDLRLTGILTIYWLDLDFD